MALRGIQEYIARDANNIVSIEGNIFIYPQKRAIQYHYYYLYRALCVILLSYNSERLPAAILSVYKQPIQSACMCRVIIVGHYSGHILLPGR